MAKTRDQGCFLFIADRVKSVEIHREFASRIICNTRRNTTKCRSLLYRRKCCRNKRFSKGFCNKTMLPNRLPTVRFVQNGYTATITSARKTKCFQVGHLVQQRNRKDNGLYNRWISKLYSYFCSLFLTAVCFGNELSCLLSARRVTSGMEKIKSFLELCLRWGGRHSYTMRKLRCRVHRAGGCYSLG